MSFVALEHDKELEVSRVKEATRSEMQQVHVRELAIKEDMIRLLQEKVALLERQVTPQTLRVRVRERSQTGSHDSSDNEDGNLGQVVVPQHSTTKKLTLPSLPQFTGS